MNLFYVRCIFRYHTLWLSNRKNCQTQPVRQIRRYHSSICLTPGDSDFSSEKSEMGDILRIILWDYGMLDNLEEVSLGFQSENPIAFDTENSTLNALKDNQFFGKSYKTTQRLKTIQEAQVVRILTHWPHKILVRRTSKWHNRYLWPIEEADSRTFLSNH